MKLGYYYTVTAGGAGSKEVVVNGEGNWTAVVDDERRLWQKFAVNGKCLAMTFAENGLVLVVVKVLGGSRPDNNVSTWIHIPSNVKISGRQIEEIVEEIHKLYLNGTKDVTEMSFKANPILGQDFDEKRYGLRVKAASGIQCAYRSGVSDWSISEILDKPFQDYYPKYKFVFLYREDPIDKEGLTDLSAQEILDMLTVLPPSIDSLRKLLGTGNVTVNVDSQNFSSPILRKKGSQLMLTAHRNGYLPVHFYAQVLNDEQEPEYLPVKEDWRKILGGVTVDVRDEKTDRSIYAEVGILDPEWDANTQSLPENRLHDVKIKVTATGYEPEERRVDFTRPISPIYLRKPEERKEYSFRTKDGRKLKILIIGEGASSSHPIDGYTASYDKLVYKGEKYVYNTTSSSSLYSGGKPKKTSGFTDWNSWMLYVLIGIATIGICAGIWAYYSGYFSDLFKKNSKIEFVDSSESSGDNIESGQPDSTAEETEEQKQNLQMAIQYIEKCNGVLDQDSLLLNPETVGLFEALNEFKLSEVAGKWNEKFGEVPIFKSIVKAAEACIKKNNDPTCKNDNGKYNIDGDTKINITRWIYWVDDNCSNRKQAQPAEKSSSNSQSKNQVKGMETNQSENERGKDF